MLDAWSALMGRVVKSLLVRAALSVVVVTVVGVLVFWGGDAPSVLDGSSVSVSEVYRAMSVSSDFEAELWFDRAGNVEVYIHSGKTG